jgi:hypothetical protein
MEQRLRASGVRVFTSEAAKCIDNNDSGSVPTDYLYRVSTSQRSFYAKKKLLINIPPRPFRRNIKGKLGTSLSKQSEMNYILPNQVITVMAWWPERWWDQLVFDPSDPDISPYNAFRIVTDGECVNRLEFPGNPYAKAQNVTRIVYDDGQCVPYWTKYIREGRLTDMKQEILRQVRSLLPSINILDMVGIHASVQPNAWHFLKPFSPHTNVQIKDWALAPLGDASQPLCLIGEGFNLQRSGWSDGAVKSSLYCLKAHFPEIASTQIDDWLNCGIDDPYTQHLSNEMFPPFDAPATKRNFDLLSRTERPRKRKGLIFSK